MREDRISQPLLLDVNTIKVEPRANSLCHILVQQLPLIAGISTSYQPLLLEVNTIEPRINSLCYRSTCSTINSNRPILPY